MALKIFLSAKWEYLAMLNYEVDAEILQPYLPPYTELDYFNGKAFVSVVGFLFNDTKVLGVKWPGFVNFEEVNLRYYIKRFDGQQWRRGVGFVSEIVPSYIVASMANWLYNEHYSKAQMRHKISVTKDVVEVDYSWKTKQSGWNKMTIKALSSLQDIEPGSMEEFIFEHYFGYNGLNNSTTIEYQVEHPRWQIYPVTNFVLDADIEKLYGKEFAPYIDGIKPHSVFLARGSQVNVRKPLRINNNS